MDKFLPGPFATLKSTHKVHSSLEKDSYNPLAAFHLG